MQVDKVVSLCLDHEQEELIFTIIQLLAWRTEIAVCKKSAFVLSMFN